MLTKGNGVLAMFSADGVFPDTADDVDIAAWFDRLHNALKNIAAEDVELTVYQCRGEADPSGYQARLHPAPFVRELDAAYRDSLFRGLLYSNRLFLAVQLHPPNVATQSVARFLADAGTDPRTGINERRHRLTEICDLLQAQLATFGLRRWAMSRRGRVIFDEIAEAIVFAMTGTWRQIGATTGRMGHAMFSEALRFRRKHLEIHGAGDPAYAAMYAFKEYPATTWPGMFHGLAVAPYRCTLMQSYRFLSNAAGMGAIGRKQNKMLAAGDKALSQSEALTAAADELMSRRWVLGDHSLVLIAFADSPRAIAEVGNAAWRDLAACGLVATRMTHALQAAYRVDAAGRRVLAAAARLCEVVELCCFRAALQLAGGRGARTLAGSADRDLPHARRHALSLPLAGWRRRQHPGHRRDRVGQDHIGGVPDRDDRRARPHRGARPQARLGPLNPSHGRRLCRARGRGAALAPLKALDASPRNIEFLTELIRGCIGGKMTEEEGRRLALGLATIMELPPRTVGSASCARSSIMSRKGRGLVSTSGAGAASSAGSSTRRSTPCASGN